jgi:hypothetical protein
LRGKYEKADEQKEKHATEEGRKRKDYGKWNLNKTKRAKKRG